MSAPLYQKNGGPPQVLPYMDTASDGTTYTNLAYEPESRAILGWVEAPTELQPLPAEIPMHKARKALRMRGPAGAVEDQDDPSWFELVQLAIASVPNKVLRGSLQDELDTAPNMVLGSANTQMLKAGIGMSDEEFELVARLALTLP